MRYTIFVYRRVLIVTLLFGLGLQNCLLGYASALAVEGDMVAEAAVPCPVHGKMSRAHAQHPKGSTPASCIAHCTAVAAVVSLPIALAPEIVRVPPDCAPPTSFPTERPAPRPRPPPTA